ncbi:bifunctional 5,10-methylenetetrahydrofolate dehydrogenase/5,10-methenyltetrahydrofolate cyclohydrolase [Pseudonocardia endophytica]|uniref:Bifunctional protein FolD n=1 Tax=Pseudonocardia endophytica TaxID=401976 RepID=A0A4R1HV44_PSEEN|nr:tetrahydrofolate dehydrogenase/cyclohydrolase catalytic domain-containing protein [Pseudonocardia endophytica]TCK21332.1 methylenetetrahydrofolate dehydrogenase (NADP+)/methenyltetrahydrofolate cyclohydrolase [Pseudonocardia endophytica]
MTPGIGLPPRSELLDGRLVAKELKEEVRHELDELRASGHECGLATVMVGDDYSAAAYERRLRRLADALEIRYRHYWLAAETSHDEVARVVHQLNADPSVHGILLLRPLPVHVPEPQLFSQLDPCKDIEALHPENAGLLALGTPRFLPSTPASVFHILDRWLDESGQDRDRFYKGATIVVVGRSNNVGKPTLALGHARGAVVISCDEWASRSGHLAEFTLRADVLVVAAGVPDLISAEHVSDGAVLIDVGINPVTDSNTGRVRLVGDIDLPAVLHLARAATPVPGGVGPVTDVWLMKNCVAAARQAN